MQYDAKSTPWKMFLHSWQRFTLQWDSMSISFFAYSPGAFSDGQPHRWGKCWIVHLRKSHNVLGHFLREDEIGHKLFQEMSMCPPQWLLFIHYLIVYFVCICSCHSKRPNPYWPPPLIPKPVVRVVDTSKLVCHINRIHVVVILVNHIQTKKTYFGLLLLKFSFPFSFHTFFVVTVHSTQSDAVDNKCTGLVS